MGVKEEFAKLAAYNRWANERLYDGAATLSDDAYRRDLAAFFGSVHATLNHLLLVDRLWLDRVGGRGKRGGRASPPPELDSVLFDDFEELRQARAEEDDGLVGLIEAHGESTFAEVVSYRTGSGREERNTRVEIFTHLFNHQTHHRGQTHALLTRLGHPGPVLDYIYFLREATS